MQLNLNEQRLLQAVVPPQSLPSLFQLPALHESVPRIADFVRYQSDFNELARNLVEAGIISHDDLSDAVVTPQQVIAEGLGTWFNRRISRLEHMRFDVEILDADNANSAVEHENWTRAKFTGPTMAIKGGTAQLRYVEDYARYVEKQVPGLFLAAYAELVSAGYRTVEVQHPQRILENETAYSLWGDDVYSVKDDQAREELVDRFGDELDIEYYMPEAVLEAYGNGFCFDIPSRARRQQRGKKRTVFSNRKLRKLARHQNKRVASIATGLLSLRIAAGRVKELDVRFDQTDRHGLRSLWVACILLFNSDDRVSQYMDQEGQYLWENGEGTDYHAVEELPTSVSDLKTYFQNLDALFELIAQMDALIPKISYDAYEE
jgi:PRTRC genetic system protein F